MIKSGKDILDEINGANRIYRSGNDIRTIKLIDTQLAEILAVCEPIAKEICTAPNGHSFFLHSHLDVIPFKDLIAKLKEVHGKD